MRTYIFKRLLGVLLNLVLVSIFIFALLRLVPGDPSAAVLGADASPEQFERFREEHGLNDSVVTQYFRWAGGVLHGDFGKSLRTSFPVGDEFMSRLPRTLEIVVLSFSMTVALGIVGGVVSATRQNSLSDYSLRFFTILGLSIPGFLLLTLLLILPARWWDYAPPFGSTDFFDDPLANLRLFVPASLLVAVSGAAVLMRLTRSAFLEELRQDYMRTARSKGLTERVVIYRHGFRNALPPILTLAALQLGNQLNGSVILESVMGIPGLGAWALAAVRVNDYPIIMAVALYTAALLMVISLVVDILYAVFDPRVRYS